MHKPLIVLGFALLLVAGTSAHALGPDDGQDGWSWEDGLIGSGDRSREVFSDEPDVPGYLCDDCRDVYTDPMDFVAMAYNGYFGDDPWMWESQLGIPFRIYNLQGQWVAVWFEGVIFDSITFLPDTLDVRLRLPNGQILTFSVLQDGPDLPIGNPDPDPDPETPVATNNCSCGGGGGGEGEDDYAEPDEGLPEPVELPEPSGVVTILDPDEDGEFPEWELEL